MLLLVMLLLVAGYVPVKEGITGTSASAASAVCAVIYQVNQWTGGFTAQVQVTNNGAALSGWTLTWSFTGNQQITSAWNAQITQSGAAVTAQNVSYNGSLPTGGSVQFGFQASFSGSNDVPGSFALNGTVCGGAPTATPTASASPTATPTLSASPTATATVAATPTPSSGGGCAGAIFCDTFENQTGSTPSGVWQVSYPNCQGTGTVTVDRTVAHSGSTSIRVDGHTG